MGSVSKTCFALMCLISAAHADQEYAGSVGGSIFGLILIGLCIWGCCYCCRSDTHVTVVSAPPAVGGGLQNTFVIPAAGPQHSGIQHQQYTPMPQPYTDTPQKYAGMPNHPPQYGQ